jgi:trehalose synthase (EC:5.4.99.16)
MEGRGRAGFLLAYEEAVRDAGLYVHEESLHHLLDLFVLEKAFYELRYELDHRPDWVEIPLRGILELLAQPAEGGRSAPA